MAREGKKLELYEILAAKRAKGKIPPGFDSKGIRPANSLDDEYPDPPPVKADEIRQAGMIIDDAVSADVERMSQQPAREEPQPDYSQQREAPARRKRERQQTQAREMPEPAPMREARPRSPREVVFALDTAMIFFAVAVALVTSSYFLGYKRGQEEKPAGLAGDIEVVDPDRINFRNLEAGPRPTMRPPEQDYTVLLRSEPATGDIPERLELELAEAVNKGRQLAGFDIQGFIFRSEGNSGQYYHLTVGLGSTVNDQELNKLLQIYNKMDGITFSRVPQPYLGCQVAPIRDLGTPVY